MSAVIIKRNREDLLQEISNIFHKWTDLERSIFAQAHYYGQSPESISYSLKMEVDRVRTILKQCDRKLHTSLREFRMGDSCKTSLISPVASGPKACEQEALADHYPT